jgi:hypothetical protein
MSQVKTFLGSPVGLFTCLAGAALGAYLLVYHLNHVALLVPYLFLLACPLMHASWSSSSRHPRRKFRQGSEILSRAATRDGCRIHGTYPGGDRSLPRTQHGHQAVEPEDGRDR